MSDFIERLRKWDRALQPVPPEKLLKEAADEIDRLESENERLKWAAEGQGLEYEKLFLENERLEARVADLEGARKRDCCAFFRWFWNAPGTNAEQGYDQWKALKD